MSTQPIPRPSARPSRRRLAPGLLALAWLLGPCLPAHPASVLGPGGSGCDPTTQSCAPSTPPVDIGGGGGGGGGSCGPSPGGGTNACNSAGPASQGNNSGTDQGAGNPIHLISGNKYQREIDLPALPGVLGLEIVRHYNSRYSLPRSPLNLLGRGWRLSYETELRAGPHTVQVLQADGTRLIFQRQRDNPALCSSSDPSQGQITELAANSGQPRHTRYQWRWPDGRQLLFNHAGRLLSITAPSGETLTLAYDSEGWLRQVTDPQGRSLQLHLADRAQARAQWRQGHDQFLGITRISSPVGDFHYTHAAPLPPGSEHAPDILLATLSAVQLPGPPGQPPLRRTYHHEDPLWPTLLTGISVHGQGSDGQPMHQRLSTYGYDTQGRAVLSSLANGVQRVSLAHPSPGITHLTNSLGQLTTYRHAIIHNQWRLLEARGPGCASCGPSNRRYAYDAQARLVRQTELSPQGLPLATLHTPLDPQGRPLRIERIAYTAQGRALAPQRLRRFEYPDAQSPQPSLIARPSVVPGLEGQQSREWQLRIQYNPQGQPTEITESGFSPLNDLGQPKPTPLQRSTRYTYQSRHGRSLLVQIDGPLPNGPLASPADSDITTLSWDASGSFIVERIEPGQVHVRLSHDAIGRVQQSQTDDGQRLIQTDTRYAAQANAVLQAESQTRTGWLLHGAQPDPASQRQWPTLHWRHDALGRLSQSLDPNGRSLSRQYDDAGRLRGLQDAQGYRRQQSLDPENHLLTDGLYRPQDSDQPYRANYWWHNDLGQPTRLLHPDGRLDTWHYDERGRLNVAINGEGIQTLYWHDPALQGRLQLSPDGWLRVSLHTPSTSPDTWLDDLGRLVYRHLPELGTKVARYDAADQLISLRQADGSRIEYDWNFAGHLQQKRYLDAQGTLQSKTELHYKGRWLSHAVDPEQTTHYEHDALGRPNGQITLLNRLSTPLTTATDYQPHTGRVSRQTLANGHVLRPVYEPAAGHLAPTRLLLQSAWVAWVHDLLERWAPTHLQALLLGWLPAQPLADDIRLSPFDGLTQMTAGNGLRTQWRFDPAGRLLQLDTDGLPRLSYAHGVGPRIVAISHQPPAGATPGSAATASNTLRYRYQGFGQLVGPPTALAPWSDGPATSADALTQTGPARLQPAVWPAQRDKLGRSQGEDGLRFSYTPSGQLASVHDAQGQLIARYAYNSLRQRVRKTLADGHSTHYLWRDGRLVAEIDNDGHIHAQYLSLGLGAHSLPLAKLEGDGQLYFIHNDHRGAPRAMSDAQRRLVWHAPDANPWDAPLPTTQTAARNHQPSSSPPAAKTHLASAPTLALRLPGQYFDAETGLHDNTRRSYHPGQGRYLQPDPLGYPDGPEPYLYAQGDPLNRIDPLGLYQIDMHYDMTLFLALASGMDYENARITALADQFIDENPMTRPLDDHTPWSTVASAFKNHQQLVLYHFVLADSSDPASPAFGHTLGQYDNSDARRVIGHYSPQLNRLYAASQLGSPTQPCARYQFLGEFLHAYADTFSHRDRADLPFDAIKLGVGVGHGLAAGSEPDYTYDDGVSSSISWETRQSRTLAAMEAVFQVLQKEKAPASPGVSFAELLPTLQAFVATRENEGNTSLAFKDKRNVLTNALQTLISTGKLKPTRANGQAVTGIDLTLKTGLDSFSNDLADKNRKRFLGGLSEADYPGVCLPGGTRCVPY